MTTQEAYRIRNAVALPAEYRGRPNLAAAFHAGVYHGAWTESEAGFNRTRYRHRGMQRAFRLGFDAALAWKAQPR